MLKLSPCRFRRSKGYTVKQVLQVCLLLAICIWLVKQSYEKKKQDDDSNRNMWRKMQGKLELLKLGRKDIRSRTGGASSSYEIQWDKEEVQEYGEDGRLAKEKNGWRGGGDDEIDGHYQERVEEEESEELEYPIDVDDTEMWEELQDGVEKGINLLEYGSSITHGWSSRGKSIALQGR